MSAEAARWRIELTLSDPANAAPFEESLAAIADTVSLSETEGGWLFAAYCDGQPDDAQVAERVAVAARAVGLAGPGFRIVPVPETDWIRHVEANTPPVTAGRFFVHGSHVTAPVPDGLTGIRLDAGPAFGTGAHETTRGCLMALDRLAAVIRPEAVLDMGCGSGILAIAASLLWHCPVFAVDNDPTAVSEARANGADVTVLQSQGFAAPELAGAAPFTLILANILAGPLTEMADDLVRHLAPGGTAVLSGILENQAADVTAAYNSAGLILRDTIALAGWPTLILTRR